MLKIQYYNWGELEDLLNVQFTKSNGRAKLISRNIAPFYEYQIAKEGRKTIGLNIIGFKGEQKSEFIQLCEEVAGVKVSFPNEKTAEKLLHLLMTGDRTIFSYEELGKFEELERRYTRQTVSVYMRKFQEIGIIPKQKQIIEGFCFDGETGELFGKGIDPNKWTYYKVHKNERKEVYYSEYREMVDYINEVEKNMIMPLIDKAKDDAELINYYRKQYKKQARYSCIEEFGYLPKRALSKVLTEKAQNVFEKYFDNNIEVEDKTNETVIKVNDNPTLDDNEKDTKQKYTSCIGLLRNCEYIKIPQVEKPIGRIDKYKALKDVMNSVI
ncbi:hypothetical protein AB1I92_06240 [Bacillus mobilis]|uniref:hypothetical protein n=1 Tax=Bacillus cereus group TaxID=86661 RepID=UPI0022E409B8|nr:MULTISPECIES: hypothetical protein [unclassified Bacillus cereus group]HDR4581921.1 hypothetical protein [Bacillus cereus]MDA1615818.1 hypothetical protein [Bacillus cereus group sp. TH204-1LC]MDX5819865.1 hypothetical protein [Bacillus cereus group sp. BfR-BA-02490]MDX5881789.1 hypothetical protein [Bacillus cereus group sp. BfR-BA-00999]HDR4585075.1 hypothetical protein [Bacillus cereus]